ncbi:baseplate J/gp47 family protein [Neomegalonema sp.]|uniref:baseplate assembly protein n=1 Tax=Neomegalonema sp. TaxID=2039713 RepID=UPI00260597E8|nr:baseplate J/gp47 family protein [Neomegalonema sp.]MDD2870136.1 baseplate J/gp47 family protein [Neomegalonema sp.]
MADPMLPEPSFVERDPRGLTAQMVANYEAMTGRKLQPAQVERLLIDVIAYRESLVRIAIQEAAKQNLLAYAAFPMLDHLGDLWGVRRLDAAPAVTTLRFSLEAPRAGATIIPKGARVRTGDGRAVFAATAPLEIPADATSAEIAAAAEEAGETGNGYVEGQIAALLDPLPGISAVNVSTSHGGRAHEDDDRLRTRIREAPRSFSVAGPVGAYRWHAMSAHQSITDVAVTSPRPGLVRIHVLTDVGAPGQELLDLVQARLSNDKIRPLTDRVEVVPPIRAPYRIRGSVTFYRDVDALAAMAAVSRAAEVWAAAKRAALGRDLVESQLVAALSVSGVYRVQLEEPLWRELGPEEWADCTEIGLLLAGAADG